MGDANRDQQLNIRVTKEEKEMIEEKARKEERSLANFIVWIVGRFKNK